MKLIPFILLAILPAAFSSASDFRFYDSRYTFLADLDKVKIGFSKNDVEKIMGKYFKGTNWPASGKQITIPGTKREKFEVDTTKTDQLTLKYCDVYRHSNEGKYDSDWGIICYKDGSVDYVDFAAD